MSALLHDDMSAFELGVVTEVFGLPLAGFESSWYRLAVCAERPGPVPILGGATIDAQHGLDAFASADMMIVPGGNPERDPAPAVLDAIRLAYRRGSRLVSISTGPFVLAATGLLDGRRAATHWLVSDQLAERFPKVVVDPTVLYAEDHNIFTSAGSAAGLDLCVHLVRQDFGTEIATALARRLLIAPHREGHHSQIIERPVRVDATDDRLARSMDWAVRNLEKLITLDMLAQQAHMSPRTYLRHFANTTGTTPIRWLILQRINASLPLLENTQRSVEQIAADVGFDRAVTFRHHFGRLMGASPAAYRRAFTSRQRG